MNVAGAYNVNKNNPGGFGTYQFWAAACKELGAKPWLTLQPHMSDACLQAVADSIAPYCPGTEVICEVGDEAWNFGFLMISFCTVYGQLLAYVRADTDVNEFYRVPASSPTLNSQQVYVILSAHQHNVLQTKFDALGSEIQVGRLFGSQYTGSAVTSQMIPWGQKTTGDGGVLQQKVPMSYIPIAPYIHVPSNNVTFNHAIATSGTNPGSWPCSAILDWYRHYFKYSTTLWGNFSSQATAIAGYARYDGPTGYAGQVDGLPALIGYEGGPDFNQGSNGLVHDLFYSPGPYPPYTGYGAAFAAFLQTLQDGDPRQPGSGLQAITITCLGGAWNGNDLWNTMIWQDQAIGSGVDNVFTTAQGGDAGPGGYGLAYDLQNESIAQNAILAWAAVANAGAAPPDPSFTVRPTRITPNNATARTLYFSGTDTAWSSGSTVSITDSVTGTTDVTAGTWTAVSESEATLDVTTGSGTGSFTVTIDGVDSPPVTVGPRRKGWFGRMSRTRLAAS
jgi:hypothetical protein